MKRLWPTLRDYLRVVLRRLPLLLLCVVLVPAIAVALALRQHSLYSSSAEVLLQNEDLASSLAGVSQPYVDPVRFSQTQVALAETPDVAERVVRAAKVPGLTAGAFLGSASVSANANADLLDFTVTDRDPGRAALLATTYGALWVDRPPQKLWAPSAVLLPLLSLGVAEARARLPIASAHNSSVSRKRCVNDTSAIVTWWNLAASWKAVKAAGSENRAVNCARCGSRATSKVISRVSFKVAKPAKYSEAFLDKARPFLRAQKETAQYLSEGKGSEDAKTFQLAEQIGERIDRTLAARLPSRKR